MCKCGQKGACVGNWKYYRKRELIVWSCGIVLDTLFVLSKVLLSAHALHPITLPPRNRTSQLGWVTWFSLALQTDGSRELALLGTTGQQGSDPPAMQLPWLAVMQCTDVGKKKTQWDGRLVGSMCVH
uniref:Uncharacterized protein n=1 Tax=Eutreptiella gymnastica TaxID=73025 RepID=A0A7S4FYH7_9EUGL|mmetsp:Transcript_79244/g.132343  ORF Transcript_79244/g.132343 Transcript_79244/m.132343 type:complete len:127 (+) Transcript_79244:130-510(+)